MATATLSRRTQTATRRPNHRQPQRQPQRQRTLVTDHYRNWAALVTTSDDLPGEGLLLHDIGSNLASIRRQADEINRDHGARKMGMQAYVCEIEVYLDRGASLEAATAARNAQANVDPHRMLVTRSIFPFAALVVACADENCNHDNCESLVSDIGDPAELARQAEEANRDRSNIREGIIRYVCPVDVWLEREWKSTYCPR